MLATRAECKKPLEQTALAATRTAPQKSGHDGRRRCSRLIGHTLTNSSGTHHLRDGVPLLDSQVPKSNHSCLFAHDNGWRSSNMVGMNSETVGWMCTARCRTVYGALAYMISRMQ